jgi:hypothetical protein
MVYQPHYREFPRPVHIQDGLLRVTNTNHITGSFTDQFIFKTDCFVLQTPTTLPGVSPTSSYSRRTASCYKHQPHYREFHRLVHIQDGLLRDDL